jgi:hypothetical protein
MTELFPFLALVALALLFVSALLYIRMGSLGVSRAVITRVLIELWGTFALVTVLFASMTRLVPPIRRGSVAEEVFDQFARVGGLPFLQQALLILGFAAAFALFVHLLWTLRSVQRHG